MAQKTECALLHYVPSVGIDEISTKAPAVGTRPEDELLLCCARTCMDSENAERIKALLREDIDWAYLTQMALRHGVMPLLYRSLYTTCPEAVPGATMDQLQSHFYTNALHSYFLTGELLKLLNLFEAHGIPPIPFKGPVLAASVYGDLALRQFGDLDILVHERDVLSAKDLLISQGYRPDPKLQLSWEAHFVHDDGRITVDLHWGITPKDTREVCASFPFDLEGLWERLEPVSLAGTTVRHFSPEDLLLIRCQDAVKEYFKDEWPEMRWICDIAELIRVHQELDWGQVMEQARKLGSQCILFLCLSLAHDLLGAPLPKEVWQRMQADPQLRSLVTEVCGRLFHETDSQNRFFDPQRGFLERNLFCIRLKERPQDRISYYLHIVNGCRNRARRAITNKKDRALLPLPASLSFLYYVLAFLYYLLRPIWRVGKYGLRRVKRLP